MTISLPTDPNFVSNNHDCIILEILFDMKELIINKLYLPNLINEALNLPKTGSLEATVENLTFLDIDDKYIFKLYPMLATHSEDIKMPNYFGLSLIGAHISVIYPEENTLVRVEDLGKTYQFEITGAFSADIDFKRYYILGINSPELLALRNKYALSDKLWFKQHLIDLHITIGISELTPLGK